MIELAVVVADYPGIKTKKPERSLAGNQQRKIRD
jgi:hypothetical protein